MASDSALSLALGSTTLETLRSPDKHDAIIIGGGAAGGLAAMLLAEAGLQVLVLDAGLPSKLLRTPLRRLTGHLVQRLSTPESLAFCPPVSLARQVEC